jgi:hypothetical protein
MFLTAQMLSIFRKCLCYVKYVVLGIKKCFKTLIKNYEGEKTQEQGWIVLAFSKFSKCLSIGQSCSESDLESECSGVN